VAIVLEAKTVQVLPWSPKEKATRIPKSN